MSAASIAFFIDHALLSTSMQRIVLARVDGSQHSLVIAHKCAETLHRVSERGPEMRQHLQDLLLHLLIAQISGGYFQRSDVLPANHIHELSDLLPGSIIASQWSMRSLWDTRRGGGGGGWGLGAGGTVHACMCEQV